MSSALPSAAEFSFDAGSALVKILMRDGGLMSNLERGRDKVEQAALVTAHSMAPEVENYMKGEAPWQDQTGNARNGLFARAYHEGDEVGIVLGHSVSYGIWLEVRWGGRYAIIDPTIEAMGPRVMRRFERLLDRM